MNILDLIGRAYVWLSDFLQSPTFVFVGLFLMVLLVLGWLERKLNAIHLNTVILKRGLEHLMETEDERLSRYERETDLGSREGP